MVIRLINYLLPTNVLQSGHYLITGSDFYFLMYTCIRPGFVHSSCVLHLTILVFGNDIKVSFLPHSPLIKIFGTLNIVGTT